MLVADRSGAGERVTEHDRLLLMGFANQAAIALENARLYGEALEKQRLEQELAAAGRIQQLLLPQALPEVKGFDISGTSRPSRGVSGDYYDVVEDRSGRVWVALGDVSGKGMPAALTMATLRALFRSELEREASLAEAMRRIGEGLWRCTAPEVFATFCFGALDPEERAFTFVNAGHPYPLLIRGDGSPPSPAGTGGGLPVGVDPALAGVSPYLEQRVDMRSGDVFVIYSDGVTEAGDGEGDMFGEERLEAVLFEHRTKDAAAVQEAICGAVSAFLGDAPPGDDLTLVVIKAK
ncbi:PP2C family protein-serine/threonine phosphatase [bacterium]|nr:PP2C family protein-serine/threonine phosphatase [bacterium]